MVPGSLAEGLVGTLDTGDTAAAYDPNKRERERERERERNVWQ